LAVLLRPGEAMAAGGATEAPAEVPSPAAPHPDNGHLAPAVEPSPATGTAAEPDAPGVEASPLARSLARQAGLDLAALAGGGPRGRLGAADVLAALGAGAGSGGSGRPAAAPTGPGSPTAEGAYDEVPHTAMRRIIADRLGAAKRTIPHFYLEAHCCVDVLLALREELRAGGADPAPSLNDFALRAAALALRRVPEANASWTDAATRRHRRVDLAFAVATDGGLLAPVLRDADRKGLAELAAEARDLAARARAGRLHPSEYQGGTFTVSNLGMHGVDALYAIVDPPQAGILGLGAAAVRPTVRAGAVVAATMLTCTLSADHRVLDGVAAARFLTTFRGLLERPLAMLL
jgi:pyruvate dehydrogenase E2 component (dihydrolipoamide acetyltransferase)